MIQVRLEFRLVLMRSAAFRDWCNKLHQSRKVLWVLMLSVPFPYIATTAGWWTAELGRQPWVIHGLLRTADPGSPQVNAGNVVFTTLGFSGLYLVLNIFFLYQVMRVLNRGPVPAP